MASLTSQLILRLVDNLSGPAGRVGGALSKTAADVRNFGQSVRGQDGGVNSLRNSLSGAAGSAERMSGAQRRMRLDTDAATAAFKKQLDATRAASYAALNSRGAGGGAGAAALGAGALGARGFAMAGGAYGVARTVTGSISSFAELDRQMRRVGLTADATSAQVADATGSVKALAMTVALPLGDVVKGLEALVAQGRSLPESMSFLPAVAKTAQAAGAEVADIAKSADALSSHLKISAGEMQLAFDALVAGGKAGQFELKDMARYLPSLAPAAKALGLEGQRGLETLVAMLQIIRKGSGTSEEAASSMQNILQKMSSEETTKRFKKMGVDLEAAFAKGKKEGRNLLEVFEESAWQAIKGDLSQLPKLISDMEFARGVRAILSMRGEWQKMAEQIRATAGGAVLRDFNEVASDSAARIQRLSQSWSNFKTSLGATLAPAIIPALEKVQQKLDELRKESDRSTRSDRRKAERDAYMAEAGRASPLMDENGKYIGPRTATGGSSWLSRLFNPSATGPGRPGQRGADLAAARWSGITAAIGERITGENNTLAAPGRIEEMIRRQQGLAGASAGRASMPGMAGVTAREQIAKSNAEIARLQGELATARAQADAVTARRAAAPGEMAAIRSRILSGAFGMDGPSGTSPGTIGSGLLGFGLRGPVRPSVDASGLDAAAEKASETRASLDRLGDPTRVNLDSSDIARAVALVERLNAGLGEVAGNASRALRATERGVSSAVRGAYSDYGMDAAG